VKGEVLWLRGLLLSDARSYNSPGPNATRGFRSGDYELVKIVEGKPSYKKAREGLRSMELFLVPAAHNPPVCPFT